MITFVVFDLDGTLLDSAGSILRALDLALADAGITGVRLERSVIVGPPMAQGLQRVLPHMNDAERAAVVERFRARYDIEEYRHASLYDGVRESLAALAAYGVALHVVTNKPARVTRAVLDQHGIAGLFTSTASPDSEQPQARSKTEVLTRLLASCGRSAGQGVLVGDSEDDAGAACACGLRFVAMTEGYGAAHRQTRYPVHATARTLAEAVGVIRRWQEAGASHGASV